MGGEEPARCNLKLYEAFPIEKWPTKTLSRLQFEESPVHISHEKSHSLIFNICSEAISNDDLASNLISKKLTWLGFSVYKTGARGV